MRKLIHMTWKEIEALDRARTILVMPIGSVEQHGPHLPVGTDFFLAEKLADQLLHWEERSYLGVVLPVIPFGVNCEHVHFPGTVCVGPEHIEGILEGQVDSFLRFGFSRFVILNSHGGNTSLLDGFIRRYRMKHPCQMTAFTYLSGSVYRDYGSLFENDLGLDVHAGEFETSIMQYFYPELVQMDGQLALDECNLPAKELPPGWLTHEWSRSGVMGRPSLASAEKGKKFFEIADRWLWEKMEAFAAQSAHDPPATR